MTTLDDLITPRHAAVVGASDDPTRIGGRPLRHMINQKFEGDIYPVNPRRDKIQGLRAYPSIADIDGDLDFVLVAVPAPAVVDVVIDRNATLALRADPNLRLHVGMPLGEGLKATYSAEN